MPSPDRIKSEATRIVKVFKRLPFEDCIPLRRKFEGLSHDTGLYAFKSSQGEILYVGKANSFLTRFKAHHILNALYLDEVPLQSVRIALEPLRGRWLDCMVELESLIIFVLTPRYNTNIPSVKRLEAMFTQSAQATSGTLKDVLEFLPGNVVDALEDYADAHGMTDLQVLELAIVGFLNLEATSFAEIGSFKSVGALKEHIAILETIVQKNGLTLPDVLD
jgi:hypothetical protein